MEDIAILVNSCDAYSDCWYPFFKLFDEYWHDCPYDIYLNTESLKFKYESLNIKTINASDENNTEYGARFIKCLEKIQTPYILLLIDDFFLRKSVDAAKINRCKNWLDENKDIAVFSFEYVNDEMNIVSEKYEGFSLRPRYGEYIFNLQAALWRKESLLKYLNYHENPWQLEINGTYRTFWNNEQFYVLNPNEPRVLDYGKTSHLDWGVVRGKWMIEDVKPLFDAHNIEIDYYKQGTLCKKDIESVRQLNHKTNIYDDIRSFGFFNWFKMFAWRVFRGIRKVLGFKVSKDYIDYMRKHNT